MADRLKTIYSFILFLFGFFELILISSGSTPVRRTQCLTETPAFSPAVSNPGDFYPSIPIKLNTTLTNLSSKSNITIINSSYYSLNEELNSQLSNISNFTTLNQNLSHNFVPAEVSNFSHLTQNISPLEEIAIVNETNSTLLLNLYRPSVGYLKDKIRFHTPQNYVLILWGEAFRQIDGHQHSRSISQNPSFQLRVLSSIHKHIVTAWQERSPPMILSKLISRAYSTPFNNLLRKSLENTMARNGSLDLQFIPKLANSDAGTTQLAALKVLQNHLKNSTSTDEHALLIRYDFDMFVDMPEPFNIIMFPHCGCFFPGYPLAFNHIADTLVWYPRHKIDWAVEYLSHNRYYHTMVRDIEMFTVFWDIHLDVDPSKRNRQTQEPNIVIPYVLMGRSNYSNHIENRPKISAPQTTVMTKNSSPHKPTPQKSIKTSPTPHQNRGPKPSAHTQQKSKSPSDQKPGPKSAQTQQKKKSPKRINRLIATP